MSRNLDATNFGRIGFGETLAEAETAAATGMRVMPDTAELIGIPRGALYYAWVGDTGTVSLHIIQGA